MKKTCETRVVRWTGDRLVQNWWMPRAPVRGAWLILAEPLYDGDARAILEFARRSGMRIGAVFHDALPVTRPEWAVGVALPERHAEYMRSLSEVDVIFPVSESSAHDLRVFLSGENLRIPRLEVSIPSGELPGVPRARASKSPGEPIRILCVSALEPRKNHRTLLDAFSSLKDPELRLDLVGRACRRAPEIQQEVESAVQRDSRIRWHGLVSRRRLRSLYAQCNFTVYPSLAEGIGLPVLESLWNARPCICGNAGGVAEAAAGGGCSTVDVSDAEALGAEIARLAAGHGEGLFAEAVKRVLPSWSDCALRINGILADSGEGRHPVA